MIFAPLQFLLSLLNKLYSIHINENKTPSSGGGCTTQNALLSVLWMVPPAGRGWGSRKSFALLNHVVSKELSKCKALLFNIKRHKSCYDFFFLLNYIDCDSIKFILFFLSLFCNKQIAKFFFFVCFCLVKVYCHADAAMKTVWKAWNGLLLMVKFAWFLTGIVWKLFII